VARDGMGRVLGRDATRDEKISSPRCIPSRADKDDTGVHSAVGLLYCSDVRRPRRAVGRRRRTIRTL
jgi:hypothetical protein